MTNKKTLVVILGVALVAAMILPSLAISQDRRPRGRADRPDRDEPDRRREEFKRHEEMQIRQIEQTTRRLHLIKTMREMCFDESAVALIAIGALRDEVGRKPQEVIKDFEARLDKTKTLGLRNAMRMTLKDLYGATDKKDKMIEHLNALVLENDKALDKKK